MGMLQKSYKMLHASQAIAKELEFEIDYFPSFKLIATMALIGSFLMFIVANTVNTVIC